MADDIAKGNRGPGDKDVMHCSEFEAWLSEALDGALTGARQECFAAHRASCAACGLMFREAEAGMQWLHGLEDATPPQHLVHNILVATSGAEAAKLPAFEGEGWFDRLRARLAYGSGPGLRQVMQPRFAMSFAMAFFSVSMLLNFAGVRLGDVRASDLKPSTMSNLIVQTYGETQGRVVKYYENLRLVYEIESRVREIKNSSAGEQPKEKDKDKTNHNDKTSGHPENKQKDKDKEQYSLEFGMNSWALVAAPSPFGGPAAVSDRR